MLQKGVARGITSKPSKKSGGQRTKNKEGEQSSIETIEDITASFAKGLMGMPHDDEGIGERQAAGEGNEEANAFTDELQEEQDILKEDPASDREKEEARDKHTEEKHKRRNIKTKELLLIDTRPGAKSGTTLFDRNFIKARYSTLRDSSQVLKSNVSEEDLSRRR